MSDAHPPSAYLPPGSAAHATVPTRPSAPYRGRFAPSPSGPLHAGSLIAALASRLDALAHQGEWLVRIEDLDTPRNAAGATESILADLHAFGFHADGQVLVQSERQRLADSPYARACQQLMDRGLVYPCACSRKEIADSIIRQKSPKNAPENTPDIASANSAAVYPGLCRNGIPAGRRPRAWRMRCGDAVITFDDRWQGRRTQNLAREVGDFVLKRADGPWAYQLAVVVDDAEQGITDVVRGDDLIDSTPRQILLQRQLGLSTPRYLHVPVLTNQNGEKLSKQTGAAGLDRSRALLQLGEAARHIGLPVIRAATIADFWEQASRCWADMMQVKA